MEHSSLTRLRLTLKFIYLMNAFNGVIINKMRGGLVRATDTSDRTVLLVCGGTAIAGKLENYKPVFLNSLYALEQLGCTEATDTANKELLYYHVSEVFRLSPERELWVMVVPKTGKVSELMSNARFLSGLRGINGVNTIGIAGLAADETIETAINASQVMVDKMREDYIYIDSVLLEGLGTYIASIADVPNLRELDAENISVIIAQDKDVAAKDEAYKNHAATGSALGMLSVRYVHENMGSVDIENHPRTDKGTPDYSMTDITTGRWINPALSNGTLMADVGRADEKTLNDNGYIYANSFQGYTGVFLSNSHTCADKAGDYAYIEYNAVWNKAAKLVRNTLIPRIRGQVKADPYTGYIATDTISYWDSLVRKSLDAMVNAGDIADFDIYINPKQTAVSDKPFNIQVKLVANGVVHEFEIDMGFTNKID